MMLHQWHPVFSMMRSFLAVVYLWELWKIIKLMKHNLLQMLLHKRHQIQKNAPAAASTTYLLATEAAPNASADAPTADELAAVYTPNYPTS